MNILDIISVISLDRILEILIKVYQKNININYRKIYL